MGAAFSERCRFADRRSMCKGTSFAQLCALGPSLVTAVRAVNAKPRGSQTLGNVRFGDSFGISDALGSREINVMPRGCAKGERFFEVIRVAKLHYLVKRKCLRIARAVHRQRRGSAKCRSRF